MDIWRRTSDRFLNLSVASALNYEFYFLHRCGKKVAPVYVIGAALLQMCQTLSATLWQICYKGSEGTGNPVANFYRISEDLVFKTHIFVYCRMGLIWGIKGNDLYVFN
jgi:hypothetical protein